MSKVQTLRAFVQQRLTAAAAEIFEQFERTMAEYEEELCRSKEENERQRKLLRAVLQPEVRLHRADVRQLLVSKEEVPSEQQEFSSSLDQEDPPELPHIKEEEEELWSSQEGEQLQGLQEADITKFTFTAVPVKSEEDEEKPQSSQLHQRQTEHMETEADGDDCGGPEPARNCNPERNLQPATDDETSHSEPDNFDWEETGEPQSGSNPLNNSEEPVSDVECDATKTSVNFSTSFDHKIVQQNRMENQTGEKSLSCPLCKRSFGLQGTLSKHMRIHTGEKPFRCSVCGKKFIQSSDLTAHFRVHSGEKPVSCSVCKKGFSTKKYLTSHLRIHSGEKPFSCSVCKRSFRFKENLSEHMKTHTGEKPFSCSVCIKSFGRKSIMLRHMRVHTREKPLKCSVCGKRFSQRSHLTSHLRICSGEKQLLSLEETLKKYKSL